MGPGGRKFKSSDPLIFYDVDGVHEGEEEDEEEVDEAKAPLLSDRGRADEDETVKWKKAVPRKVQWNDDKGNRLVEVMEFEPSEASDSDEDDFFDSCICSVM